MSQAKESPLTFPGLIHDGACGCPAGTTAIIHPLGDRFLCSECLYEYEQATVSRVKMPVIVKAKHLELAGQQILIDCSGRSLGIAALEKEGTVLCPSRAFSRCRAA